MSVIFHEQGLAALLESPAGPVGRYVTEIAEFMEARAQDEVRAYFFRAPSLAVDQDVAAVRVEGNGYDVGIRDRGEGTKSRRIAAAQLGQTRKPFNWLGRAREFTRQAFM